MSSVEHLQVDDWVSVLVVTFVEEEPDATLGIITHLPPRSSNRHSESSSEMTTHMNVGVVVSDNAQKGWTCLDTSLSVGEGSEAGGRELIASSQRETIECFRDGKK